MENTRRRYRDNVRSEGPQAPVAGRVPPQSLEAEESVLGSISLDNQAINVCLERIRAEDFYKSGHQTIFEAMSDPLRPPRADRHSNPRATAPLNGPA